MSFYTCPDVLNQIAALARQNPRIRNSSGDDTWFSSSSFTAETIGTFGKVHRNPYHGPGIHSTNMILAKNLALEHYRSVLDSLFNSHCTAAEEPKRARFAVPGGWSPTLP